MTYEEIKKANDSIKTTDIKGKEYAEVNQRIKAFRMVCPNGYIETTMISNENGVCVFRAEVGYYDGENQYTLGTGHAYEKEGSTFINKTSYIENCETSAVGRALGMAGFGIDTSVASYEEVSNAQLNQQVAKIEEEGDKVITEQQRKNLIDLCQLLSVDIKDLGRQVGAKSLNTMTARQHGQALIILKDLNKEGK